MLQSLGKIDVKIYSVSELTRRIRTILEKSVGFAWVEGEISNLSYHPSGHVYFTLKDAQSQLNAVMFRGEAMRLRFRLKDGMQVQGYGRITVYEKQGKYQIIFETIQPAGMGNLQAAFEALKKKLEAEGLFDLKRKRPLPLFPQTVGVVTSSQGAAFRDFCRILQRRFPGLRIILAPTRVQGNGAAQEIAAAIELLNVAEASGLKVHLDVIAVIRGGGSLEDLWAFNEEVVARAVARSKIPIISGVGHEVDFTICDFVADIRAATPSAAAEILIRPKAEFITEVLGLAHTLQRASRLALSGWRHRLSEAREVLRMREPHQFIREWRQRLDEASTLLYNKIHRYLNQRRQQWQGITHRFTSTHPMLFIERKRTRLTNMRSQLQQRQGKLLNTLRHRIDLSQQQLALLSPQATLTRGYSITLDEKTGCVIRSIQSTYPEQPWITQLADGKVRSVVSRIVSSKQ